MIEDPTNLMREYWLLREFAIGVKTFSLWYTLGIEGKENLTIGGFELEYLKFCLELKSY